MMSKHTTQQSKTNQRWQCYLNALALNNVGVRLLERTCYSQALNMLECSRILMNSTCSEGGPTGDCGESYVAQCADALSHPKPARQETMLLEILTTMPDGSIVSEAGARSNSGRDDASILDTILHGTPSSHVAFPIRMEDFFDIEQVSKNYERQAAIVSHNLGIASFCLFRSRSRGCTAQPQDALTSKLQQLTLDLAKHSSFILMQQTYSSQALGTYESQCLAIVALNSLIQILRESSLQDPADDCYQLLVELRVALIEHQCPGETTAMSLILLQADLGMTGDEAAAAA